MGYAYDSIYDGTYHAVNNPFPVASGTMEVGNYGNVNFDRFCSGTSYEVNSFGSDRGFVDCLYLTGEEASGGKFYALNQNIRALWEVPDFGQAPWENGALIDTGITTHVAFILMSDTSSSPGEPIRLYIGEKGVDSNSDGEVDLLERNGLKAARYSISALIQASAKPIFPMVRLREHGQRTSMTHLEKRKNSKTFILILWTVPKSFLRTRQTAFIA